MATSIGQRGKKEESAVQDILDKIKEAKRGFDYNRQLDARAAGGRFPAQPGDFAWYLQIGDTNPRSGLIEVKAVAHDFRLPKKNFPNDEISRMRRRSWAGQECYVVVHHSTTGAWRVIPLDYFVERLSQPSWDLSEFAPVSTLAHGIVDDILKIGG